MRSPLRVESFSDLDRNEDSSHTFPRDLVPNLHDGFTRIGSCCIFLSTRSERRLVPSTDPSLLHDGVTLRVECGFSSHSIGTKSFLDSWSVFLQDEVTLFRAVLGVSFSSFFHRPACSAVGEGPTFSCLRFWQGLCVYPSRQRRSGSWPFFFFWPCCLSPFPGG